MKKIIYLLCLGIALLIAVSAFLYLHTETTSKSNIVDLKVSDQHIDNRHIVHVSGTLLSSAEYIGSIREYQKGDCIVLVVKVGLVRDGHRNGVFGYDVFVPDDVSKIAFGVPSDVIWHRQ